MTLTVNEIINWFYNGYKDEIAAVHEIKGTTLKECFGKMWALERSSRYDNVRRYEFVDPSLKSGYQKWKAENMTIGMYYGSATVD